LNQKVGVDSLLRPGFDAGKLKKLLKDSPGESMMIVGHEPDFTEVIHQLTGGNTKLSKAGVALVELKVDSMKGELRWLVPPKFAKE
jgi:phosphohistidine phosphatase